MKKLCFVISLALLASCDKNDSTNLRIHITDAPGDFQQVNIHIIGMEAKIKQSNGTDSWHMLDINEGMYDLLLLQNTSTVLVDDDDVPQGKLQEVRFILANDNTVMVDSVIHNLETPSAHSSGLKIKIDKDLDDDMNELTLDFIASESIKQTGTGTYKLEPVIKLVE